MPKSAPQLQQTSTVWEERGRSRLAHQGSAARPRISKVETHDLTRGQSLAMTCNDDIYDKFMA